MATIKDIAEIAGVSKSTVSNVINGLNKCSDKTRDRVLKVMEELNYKPNIAAKTLKTKKSNLIGLVLPKSLKDDVFSKTQFYQMLLAGINRELSLKYFDLIIMNSTNNISNWVRERNLEGIILLGEFSKEELKGLEKINTPIISIDSYENSLPNAISINSDDTLGGYLATEKLIKSGAKDIYFVSGDFNNEEIFRRRLLGYQTALMDYGLNFKEENIIITEVSLEGGKEVAHLLKESCGIFACADIIAFGIISELRKTRNRSNIQIIGFDNLESCEFISPSLTTVEQGIFEKGRLAIELIYNKLNNIEIKKSNLINLKIIERESTGGRKWQEYN